MRVGLDAKRAFNNTSGLGNYSRDVIRALTQHNDLDLWLYTPKVQKEIFGKEAFLNKENITTRLPQDTLNQTLKSYWRSFSIAKDIQKHRLDLYHGLSNEIPFTLGKTCPTVVTIHDLIFKRFPQWYKPLDRMMYDWKFKSACQNADRIVAISEQTKSDIIEFYKIEPEKITVIYQTCNDSFKTQAEDTLKQKIKHKYHLPDEFLLNVGTIEPRKNALEIVKALYQHQIDVPLIIIGRATAYTDKINSYITQHQLDKQVTILESVSNQELPAIYQMAKAFIYPSTFEGFGIPIIEALYSGTPIISSKGGCFLEAGGKDSLFVTPSDTEALADAIQKVLEQEELREKMIKNGLEYVKKFNRDIVTQHLIQLYEQLARS